MRDITLCHPRLQALAAKLTAESDKQGLKIAIGETYRTVEEQDALYAQGRTKPGNKVTNAPGSTYSSYHQWGTAFDIYRNDGLGAYNEAGNFFGRVGAIGVNIGLEWGGNWKSPVDKPHFQLPDWGSSTSGIKKVYASPEAFKKTWVPEVLEKKKSGWKEKDGGWRFYYGDTGECVRNDWVKDHGKWYWFNAAGIMVTNTWYQYNSAWYYLGPDGAMCQSQLVENSGKIYAVDSDGKMITEPVKLTPDQDGVLQYPGLVK
ncbi:peptidoglycan L-alanyl-D-glutamate endopeptidase CwlK [Lacrimispora xylanisolvens]|uniref:Peptidoglycan L-alanyl-D-glutamate endopeptidase CwlK n=1 Tax=Lacrimispora xylanisolvens TaxID=384636 RepID=A0A2S6HSE7_9FIRM|nr:M15 family metallopeptidase [Hungatella xylanolytica]PPK80604.1 peptidoglycan L-alanyl-D-glutamate endopeptidase CwlK [Hungatella xylanolytica]